jgi:hypothetical protein
MKLYFCLCLILFGAITCSSGSSAVKDVQPSPVPSATPVSAPEPTSTPMPTPLPTPVETPTPLPTSTSQTYKKPQNYNFRFVAVDLGIDDPAKDRRSYYRILIDKVEAGSTTNALESQEKVFETTLDSGRHLITVEKYVLDEKKGRFVKLNNIDQPKPDYCYFRAQTDRIAIIKLLYYPKSRVSTYLSEFEKE